MGFMEGEGLGFRDYEALAPADASLEINTEAHLREKGLMEWVRLPLLCLNIHCYVGLRKRTRT